MMEYSFPNDKKHRVIVNTDAKNEADDQYAIVHALLTPSFELHGIIPAHFGEKKSKTSQQDNRREVDLLLELMDLTGKIRIEDGAPRAIPDENTAMDSAGARLIVEEALKDDSRPLHVAFYEPLTDMASALLLAPEIEERNIRVVWIGGGPWPAGGREYNLSNDIAAAAMEYRSLGDSPAVGVMTYPDCGRWEWKPAPEFAPSMHYVHTGENRQIRVYQDIDARFILEDFFAKLKRFSKTHG